MIVKLEGTISPELVDILIQAENDCPPEDSLHVYLNTNGGSEDDMNAIINIINESEKIEVVFCFSSVFSAGFVIAMTCLKPVEFLDSCLGMFHKGTFYGGMWTDELKVHRDVKSVMKLHSKNAKMLTEKMIALGIFTKKEEEKLRKGKDVYFNTDRLRQMRDIVWRPIQDEIDAIVEEHRAKAELQKTTVLEEVQVEENKVTESPKKTTKNNNVKQ